MRRIRHITLISLIALASAARGEISTELGEAAAPLAQGVPEVAVARLETLLNKNLSDLEWRAVAEKLAEAHVDAKQDEAALVLLTDPGLRELPWAKFWRAQAFANLHRWADALPLYEQLEADETSSYHKAATFGAAEMLRALGRPDEALTKFRVLTRDKEWGIRAQLRLAKLYIDKGDAANARRVLDETQPKSVGEQNERRLLGGRLELILRRPEKAIGVFEELLKAPENVPHASLIAALFGMVDAHVQLETPDAADDLIEEFINRYPADPDLSVRDRARQLFRDVQRTDVKPPEVVGALLDFAQLEAEDRHFDEAIAILDDARLLHPDLLLVDRLNLLAAKTQYLAKRFEVATATFEQIGHSNSPLAKVALLNASAGWLQLGDHERLAANYHELERQGVDEESRADLRLEEALMQAAKGDNKAARELKQFIRDFPKSPRVSEAWVSLAELAFHSSPPRIDEARTDLARAADSKPTAAATERADYLMIWIEDSAGTDETKVIELVKRFLEQHGASPFAPEVRMKLAEIFYRRQDFANAQTQFEILAQENPDNSMGENALFFAAESAMSSMGERSLDRAIVLFDQVVRLNGALRWAARNEQAIIERKLGKPQDALVLYDEVLKSDAGPSEKREALCGKGDIFFEMAGSHPENYQRALEIYEQLASDKNTPIHWRNQALFKKALCLEKKNDRAGALATFYKVLEEETRPDGRSELFWYYKAGFNAARLLEDDSKWESAAAVYEKLAAAGGSRSEEAKARLNRLRLEHFLWAE